MASAPSAKQSATATAFRQGELYHPQNLIIQHPNLGEFTIQRSAKDPDSHRNEGKPAKQMAGGNTWAFHSFRSEKPRCFSAEPSEPKGSPELPQTSVPAVPVEPPLSSEPTKQSETTETNRTLKPSELTETNQPPELTETNQPPQPAHSGHHKVNDDVLWRRMEAAGRSQFSQRKKSPAESRRPFRSGRSRNAVSLPLLLLQCRFSGSVFTLERLG